MPVLSRSLASFLLFLLALACLSALGVWWMGPAIVSLAVDDSRRNEPYYLIHLVSLDSTVDTYMHTFNNLALEDGGELIWHGELLQVRTGRRADEWQDVRVLRFARGADLVQLMTSAGFRNLTATGHPLLLGSSTVPVDLAATGNVLFWLLKIREGAAESTSTRLDMVLANVAAFEGRTIWNTAVDPIGGDQVWDHLVVLTFPDRRRADAWFGDPLSVTERVLAQQTFRMEAMLHLQSSQFAP